MSNRYIAIEGNIGSGKTSLCRLLAKDLNGKLILESFADNPFLPRFYNHPEKHAFAMELFFMAERFQQMKQIAEEQDLFGSPIIADYVFWKSLIFAGATLSPDEQTLYKRLFHIILPNIPQPDLLIYLHAPTETLIENIRKRGRQYEQGIGAEYLETIHKRYMDFFRQQNHLRIIILDTRELDFVADEADYTRIRALIDRTFEAGIHFVSEVKFGDDSQ